MILQLFATNPPDILPIVLDAGAPLVQFSVGHSSARGGGDDPRGTGAVRHAGD